MFFGNFKETCAAHKAPLDMPILPRFACVGWIFKNVMFSSLQLISQIHGQKSPKYPTNVVFGR